MILPILSYPDPLLKQQAEPVCVFSDELRDLAAAMAETMYNNSGIGLAAPQIGKSIELIVVDISGPENRNQLVSLVNPKIISARGAVSSDEGCLSVPSLRGKIDRSETVVVTGFDLSGKEVRIEANDLFAICLQHEIDHLRGILIIDHLSSLRRSMYNKKLKKWLQEKTPSE